MPEGGGSHGGTLMVGFNRRFDPDFMAVKAAIDAAPLAKSRWSRSPAATPARRRTTTSRARAGSSAT